VFKAPSGLIRSLQFLGKVQFTMILLLAGVLIMTIGTIVESAESRDVAWSLIYGTVWFDVFLFLIGVNLVVAVINRIPIRRHQWSFVLTHFSIVLLLIGAWISGTFGYEGRLMVFEGSEEYELVLDSSEVRGEWRSGESTPAISQFPLPRTSHLAGRVLQEESIDRPGIRILQYLPQGHGDIELVEDSVLGLPGVEFRVTARGGQADGWLVADHGRPGLRDLGPLEVELRTFRSDDELREATAEVRDTGTALVIEPRDGGPAIRIPLPADLGREVSLGSGLSARVEQFLPHAQIVDGGLTEAPNAARLNPAAVVEIRAGDRTERHTVFSMFPDYGAAHGRDKADPLVAEVRLQAEAKLSKPRASILVAPDRTLLLHLRSPFQSHAARPIEVRQKTALDGLGLELELTRFLPKAQPETVAHPASNGQPFLHLEARLKGSLETLWLRYGSSIQRHLEGGELELSFAPELRALPFAIALEDFELENYPGSTRPAEYRSTVEVRPRTADFAAHPAVISMNQPLDVEGFRLFQSSYRLGEGERPDATILSVSYDPGVPLVYISFVLIVLGVAWYLQARGPRLEAEPLNRVAEGSTATREESMPQKTAEPNPSRAGTPLTLGLLLATLVSVVPIYATPVQAADPEASSYQRIPIEETRAWAILDGGRVKPLLTFANETALSLTGRESIFGLNSLEILWGYALAPNDFEGRDYIRVDSKELKTELGLQQDKRRFSFTTLLSSPNLRPLVDRAQARDAQGAELSRLENDALGVYAKLGRTSALMRGVGLTIVPLANSGGAWSSPGALANSSDPQQRAVYTSFAKLSSAYAERDARAFREAAGELSIALRSVNPGLYPSATAIDRELFYEDFGAFGKAWKLYLGSFLAVLLFGFTQKPHGYLLGFGLLVAGFVCHTVGVGTRWAIAGRAPVSDMYESLVFMGWGAIAVAMIPEALYRRRYFALVAGVVGFLTLAFAENLPIDSAINPLVPVLAHTSWLSIHVMTIMLSYSALALTMALGHVALFLQLFRPGKTEQLQLLSRLLYKTMQVGLLFLSAGIICGAVWANESWGRYWGWDPKETWSLITFFVYLAIVHAHFANWLRDFGLAASAILGFLSVIMTYYGVNFVLSAGLHSYGFADGGQIYALIYVLVEIAIVAGAFARYRWTIQPAESMA
jgi:cytochrome c-type biogenesis protein CcsB